MKYIKLSEGSVVVAEVQPVSSWIDEANDRSFVGEGYVEISDDASFPKQKYDPSAETVNKQVLHSLKLVLMQMENLDGLMKLLGI